MYGARAARMSAALSAMPAAELAEGGVAQRT